VAHHVVQPGAEVVDDHPEEQHDDEFAEHVAHRGRAPCVRVGIISPSMRRHWHSPSWLAWLLLVAGLLLFVTLGCWQWRRAAEKQALLAAYAVAASAPPRPFAAVAETPPPGAYPRVAVRGHFLADRA